MEQGSDLKLIKYYSKKKAKSSVRFVALAVLSSFEKIQDRGRAASVLSLLSFGISTSELSLTIDQSYWNHLKFMLCKDNSPL